MSKPRPTIKVEPYGTAWCVAVYVGEHLQGRPAVGIDEETAGVLVGVVREAFTLGIDVTVGRIARAGQHLRAQVVP